MAITNYGELKAAVADWLIRTDLDQRIPDMVTLAIATLNKVLRSTRMVANADIVIGGGARKGACPTDMLEPIYVQVKSDEDFPLAHVDIDRLIVLRQSQLRAQGTPRFFAIVGQSIEVSATPASSTTLDMAYYQAIPAFTNDASANWVLTYEPDILLYTTLLHAAPFLDDEAKAVYGNLLTKQIVAAVSQNSKVTLDRSGAAAAMAAGQ
ncbi:MAG: uncharacterized protein JWM33_2397 [Caulobacteraceae bacterium]|nr:uncharacterized protein [Caulobacteraceae bacterium]